MSSTQRAPYDLYFEVLRHKTHLFLDAKETDTVRHLKLMIEGILKVPVSSLELWKFEDEGNRVFTLTDNKMLAECGYSPSNAKAQKPAKLGLVVKGEDSELVIEEVSIPPPIPDAMRADPQAIAQAQAQAQQQPEPPIDAGEGAPAGEQP